MAEHNELGKKGEEIAKAFLISKGHHILVLNWRFGKEELDIISRLGELIIFTEVKSRAFKYEDASDLISYKKQKYLLDAADAYLQIHNIEIEGRFDLVFVLIEGEKHTVEHFEEAFNARF
jgi:putative endonuclease